MPLLNRKQMGCSASWLHAAVVCACHVEICSSLIFSFGGVRKSNWCLSCMCVCARVITLCFTSLLLCEQLRTRQNNTEFIHSYPTGFEILEKRRLSGNKKDYLLLLLLEILLLSSAQCFSSNSYYLEFPKSKKRWMFLLQGY